MKKLLRLLTHLLFLVICFAAIIRTIVALTGGRSVHLIDLLAILFVASLILTISLFAIFVSVNQNHKKPDNGRNL